MNNNFGNVLLVIILVLLVGFGVWYATGRQQAPADQGHDAVIQVDLDASGDATSNQGSGGR